MIVWLASYPRSGNTALRILLKAKFGLSSYSEYGDPLDIAANPGGSAAVGHVTHGLDPEEFLQEARKSRKTYLIKTHGHPTDGSKAIYVVRDGRSAIAERGLPVATVIDVGASNGMWSAVTEKVLPDADYLLVEAQPIHRDAL